MSLSWWIKWLSKKEKLLYSLNSGLSVSHSSLVLMGMGVVLGLSIATNHGPTLFHSLPPASATSCSLRKQLRPAIDRFDSYRYNSDKRSFVTVRCLSSSVAPISVSLPASEIKAMCKTWLWRGHTIKYLIYPPLIPGNVSNPPSDPLLLIHGFGASVAHWRRYLLLIMKLKFSIFH